MELKLLVLLSVAAAAAAGSRASLLFPAGQELVYHYEALVQSQVHNPDLFTSQFVMNANMHMQFHHNTIKLTMTNVTYTMYAGRDQLNKGTKPLRVPVEAESIMLPVYIQYNPNGKVEQIHTDKKDEAWSVNMKKALASLLQLDFSQINLNSSDPYGFHSEEQTIHGKCNVLYEVLPTSDTYTTITKHQTPTSCDGFKWEVAYNVEPGYCEKKPQSPITMSSIQVFNMKYDMDTSTVVVKSIKSQGNIRLTNVIPSDAQAVIVKQELEFIKSESIEKTNESADESLGDFSPQNLKVETLPENNEGDRFPDLSRGRTKVDMDIITKAFLEDLKNVVDYLRTNHITGQAPNLEHEQSVNFLIQYMRLFHDDVFEKCYSTLSSGTSEIEKESKDVFVNILPFVGTQASGMFIIKLIQTKKVDEDVASRLVQQIPFYMKFINMKGLKELSVLRDLGDNDKVKISGILAFATLLSKISVKQPEDLVEWNNYVDQYISDLETSKTHNKQILYMNALRNIGSSKVASYLEPFIKDGTTEVVNTDYKLRTYAIQAARHQHAKDPSTIDIVYWPVFTNNKEHLQVRVEALITIMLSDNSIKNLEKINNYFLTSCTSKELFNYFFTTLKSLSKSHIPCLETSTKNAKNALNFIRNSPSTNFASHSTLYDYYDATSNFGAFVKIQRVGDELPGDLMSTYISLSSEEYNVVNNMYEVYYRQVLVKDLYAEDPENQALFEAADVMSYEIVVIQQNRAVFVQSSTRDFERMIKSHELARTVLGANDDEESITKYFNYQNVRGETHITTDMGLPSLFFIKMPINDRIYSFVNPRLEEVETADNKTKNELIISFNFEWLQSNMQTVGLTVYNPLADAWHGSRRVRTFDMYVPVDINNAVMDHTIALKLQFQNNKKFSKFGFQTFVESQVYVSDLIKYEALKESCPDCKMVNVVTSRNNKKSNSVISHVSESTGMTITFSVFECDKEIGTGLNKIKDIFMNDKNKNWGNNKYMKYVLALDHLWAYVTSLTHSGMCGVALYAEPTEKKVNFYEFLIDFRNQEDQWHNTTIQYSFKQDDKLMKAVSLEALFKIGDDIPFEVTGSLKQQTYGEDDRMMCLQGVRQWTADGELVEQLKIDIGKSENNQCPKDGASVVVNLKAFENSTEKTNNFNSLMKYDTICEEKDFLPCVHSLTALPYAEIDFQYKNIPIMGVLLPQNNPLFYYGNEIMENLDNGTLNKFKVTFEYEGDMSDYKMTLTNFDKKIKEESLTFEKDNLLRYYILPSQVVPFRKMILESVGIHGYACKFDKDNISTAYSKDVPHAMSYNWTKYAEHSSGDHIYAKRIGDTNQVAVKISLNYTSMEIIPKEDGNGFQFFLNGEELPPLVSGFRSTPPFYYKVVQEPKSRVILQVGNKETTLDFDGANVEWHRFPIALSGLCAGLDDSTDDNTTL